MVLTKSEWFAMSISPISSSMMSMYVPNAGASKAAEKDTEYQQIIKKLAAYGIASSGDKETDKTRLETAEKLMATERQQIVQELAAYGIPSSGDNETDKTRLEVVERLIAMQESQQTLGGRDSIPFEDIMNTLNLTITGDLEDDYDTTIDKLDYEINSAKSQKLSSLRTGGRLPKKTESAIFREHHNSAQLTDICWASEDGAICVSEISIKTFQQQKIIHPLLSFCREKQVQE